MAATVLYLHDHAEISGGEHSLLLLWEYLDRHRFRPALLGPTAGPFAERARALDVPTRGVQFTSLRELAGRRGRGALAAVRREVAAIGPAILHGNTPQTNVVAGWVGRRLGTRVVWHERTLPWGGVWDVDRWLSWLPHRIICNSAAVARRFGGPGGRVVVIHNGVPLQRFVPGAGRSAVRREFGLGPEDVAVGMVGTFAPVKRHELFLAAAARAAARTSRVRFLVVGGEVFPDDAGRADALQAEARRLGLEDRVAFLGVRGDMPAVLGALDVLVSASEAEACSRAIVEAMACGVPVVGADAGGNPELIAAGETGLLFPPGDAAALAAAVVALAEDPARRRAMGAAARARAEAAFGIEQQVRRTEAVYESLLAAE